MRLNWDTTKTVMKAWAFACTALALILASSGNAKDMIDVSPGDPVVAPTPHPDRVRLKRADSGGDVLMLQKALNSHGEHVTVDGIFGRHTEKAVKGFQARSGLQTTGEVDSGTWSALAAKPAPDGDPARELELAKQAVEAETAQAIEFATSFVGLSLKLEQANAQRNELQTKLDQAAAEAESAQTQLKDNQSDLAALQSQLETAKQDVEQANARATEFSRLFASLNAELEKAKAQPNELPTKLDKSDQAASEPKPAQPQLKGMHAGMQSELETAKQDAEQAKARFAKLFASVADKQSYLEGCKSELETAKQDAEQAKAKATEFATLIARLNASADAPTADCPQQSAEAFRPNEQPAALYIDTPDTPAIVNAHVKVGNTLMAQGDLAEALKSYQDGLAVAVRLAKADPQNTAWQHNIALIFIKVGDVSMAQGKFAEALKSYQDALAVADRFAQSDPANADWQRDLSLAYNKLGGALAAGGNLTEALKNSQESLAIRQRLAEADADDIDAQRELAISQGQVAAVLAEQGDASHALDSLRQARAIIARLAQQSPDNGQLAKDLAVFDANIAKLERASAPGAAAAQQDGRCCFRLPPEAQPGDRAVQN
jgi:tetratricopeptide (TPR) repeat protein